jgi:hypothetical protein
VLEDQSLVAKVPAGKEASGSDVGALLGRMRDEDPDEPLWTGVRDTRVENGHVEVTFGGWLEPRLVPDGDVEVACHLYDEEARAKAGRP